MKWVLGIWIVMVCFAGFSQKDTIKVGLATEIILDSGQKLNKSSLLAVEGKVDLDYKFYKNRYVETDLMYKNHQQQRGWF